MATATHISEEEIDEVRAEEAEIEQRRRESEFYRLMRAALVGKANGDHELGDKIETAFGEMCVSMTEADFDACMERAARELGVIA